MPLDREQPPIVRPTLDRLDQPVVRPSARDQPRRQIPDCLMMKGIGDQAVHTERVGRAASRGEGNVMSSGVAGGIGVVVNRTGSLGREVLIQRPAERYVDQLNPATDAED